ncbi:MAG: hypothetical protein CSA61_01705 [Neptuniibacter caesariensis]|uniref:Pilus assembly protein PilW n=1 Tax=Neptuniibacter caesariensis TaxID=207954 RepID=A0A2G6JAK7_NEPCE|nr:MAG: hypothetical protein CSA61_01705 [Neptuniibacter caesariensis]
MRPQEKGFSLIELMIAMVLGLFIVGGVIVVFIGSSQSFNSNESLSRVQENGRFALELIARDLRNAGFKGGCFADADIQLDTTDPDYIADAFNVNHPVVGWVTDGSEFFAGDMTGYNSGTDIILIKHAADLSDAALNVDVAKVSKNFNVLGSEERGRILVLSDGALGCNLFQNTSTSGGVISKGTAGANINNQNVDFTQPFDKDEAEIYRLVSTLYYIGQGLSSSSALRSLSYATGSAVDQELVEDVTGMSIQYGIASGAGGALDYTSRANTVSDWDDVRAVRINLTVTGDENISHVFSSTVALRNRLLAQ